MARTLGQEVQDAIDSIPHFTRKEAHDLAGQKLIQKILEEKLKLRVLVQSDLSSRPGAARLNVTVWSKAGREIKNPDLRGSNRVNYFYA